MEEQMKKNHLFYNMEINAQLVNTKAAFVYTHKHLEFA